MAITRDKERLIMVSIKSNWENQQYLKVAISTLNCQCKTYLNFIAKILSYIDNSGASYIFVVPRNTATNQP